MADSNLSEDQEPYDHEQSERKIHSPCPVHIHDSPPKGHEEGEEGVSPGIEGMSSLQEEHVTEEKIIVTAEEYCDSASPSLISDDHPAEEEHEIVFEKQQCGELDGTNGHDRNKNDPDGEVESSRLVQEDSLFQPSLLSPAL